MTTFTADNAQMWRDLFESVQARRPSVGKTVRVVSGKKHIGKSGQVIWHGEDKFYSTRYRADAQESMREAMGLHGFRVGIKTADGEKFFVGADKVEII